MDISYLLFLQNLRESLGGIFDCLMSQITTLCESQVSFLLLAAVYWCVDKHAGELMCLNTSFGMIINHIIKNLCCIERPWVRDSRVKPVEAAVPAATGYSFPSGHTASVTAVYGSLGTSLWHKKSRAAAAICWGVVAFVAFSRNYLGVHTPQDVLVSLAIGILLILVLNKILEWADKGKNRDIAVAAVGIAMCAASVIITGCLSSSAGIGAGLLLGWLLERRFVKFDTSGSFAQKCVRFALGAAGVWYINYAFNAAFGLVFDTNTAYFIAFSVMGLFITFLYPIVFCKKSRYKLGWALAAVILLVPIVIVVFN